jgi:hypothetical protein
MAKKKLSGMKDASTATVRDDLQPFIGAAVSHKTNHSRQ